jgi:hypothetical protein
MVIALVMLVHMFLSLYTILAPILSLLENRTSIAFITLSPTSLHLHAHGAFVNGPVLLWR